MSKKVKRKLSFSFVVVFFNQIQNINFHDMKTFY